MTNVPLSCQCGTVKGMATNVSPQAGPRLVCYCDDCQTFARHLQAKASAQSAPAPNGAIACLDAYGGTDVVHLTPAQVTLTQGAEQLRALRLTPQGLIRWYTACCHTPIGATVSGGLPFLGMAHTFMDDAGRREANLGPVQFYIFGNRPRELKKN